MTGNKDKRREPPEGREPLGAAAEDSHPAAAEAADAGSEADRLRAELAALQDRNLRLQAEFENFRKRQQRDREDASRRAKEPILGEIAGVVDNLERALTHATAPGATPESLVQGVELVGKQLREILGRFGAVPIAALGEAFDPHLHEAMARVETSGEPPDGTVVEEYRRGYLLDGKVMRPALVAVAKVAEEDGDRSP